MHLYIFGRTSQLQKKSGKSGAAKSELKGKLHKPVKICLRTVAPDK